MIVAGLGLVLGCPIQARFGDDVSADGSSGGTSTTSEGSEGSMTAGGSQTSDEGGSNSGGPEEASTGGPTGNCSAPLRVATFNIREVGAVGTGQYEALVAVLTRIDADVVCVQEVAFGEAGRLETAASEAGYEEVVLAEPSPAIGGEISNACLSRMPMTLVESFTGSDISSDASANDVGRDILGVEVAPAPDCRFRLFTVHLKAGQDDPDRFRRQVEAVRLGQVLELSRRQAPDALEVALGDFNESLDDGALGTVFSSIPFELPGSYELGNDIELPLTYDPFEPLRRRGLTRVDARQEDSADESTFRGGAQLDHVWVRGARAREAEVYNGCRDNGVDDAPEGGWLPKAGEPLSCQLSEAASDHYPVVVDLIAR